MKFEVYHHSYNKWVSDLNIGVGLQFVLKNKRIEIFDFINKSIIYQSHKYKPDLGHYELINS